jgi:hypothetical protein
MVDVSRRFIRCVGAAFAVAAAAGLGWYLTVVGLDEADKIASVLGAFVGLAGLALVIFGPSIGTHKDRAGAGAADDTPAKTDVRNIVNGTVRGSLVQGRDFSGPINFGSVQKPSSDDPPTTTSCS